MTTPRGLSRPPTSFIGAWYQGIHRVPHLLGHHRYKMLAHTIHESKHRPHTQPQHPPTDKRRNQGSSPGWRRKKQPEPGRSLRHPTARPHPQENPEAGEVRSLHSHPEHPGKPQSTGPLTSPPAHRKNTGLKRLLRKEVIQPHLPVRLPCYDFVPIASPTFTRSLPEGLGHKFRVLPTFMT